MEKRKNIMRMEELFERNSTKQNEKTEKIQVLLSNEDLVDLAKKIAKASLSRGEKPASISEYVRELIRKDLGRSTVG